MQDPFFLIKPGSQDLHCSCDLFLQVEAPGQPTAQDWHPVGHCRQSLKLR